MSVSGFVKGTWIRKLQVVERPAETYLFAASPQTIFNINDGPVWLVALFGICAGDLDPIGATGATIEFTVNGVAVDALAPVVTGSFAGDILLCPLDPTGAAVVIVANPCECVPDLTANATGGGQVLATPSVAGAAPGLINLVVGNGNCGNDLTMYVAYYRMSPAASVTVA